MLYWRMTVFIPIPCRLTHVGYLVPLVMSCDDARAPCCRFRLEIMFGPACEATSVVTSLNTLASLPHQRQTSFPSHLQSPKTQTNIHEISNPPLTHSHTPPRKHSLSAITDLASRSCSALAPQIQSLKCFTCLKPR